MSLKAFSPYRLFKSFGYAIRGLIVVGKHEHNMHIHIIAAIIVLIAGLVLSLSRTEWCIITLCIVLVWSAELFNSAIETLTDLVSPDYNQQAGKVKDIAAGAVLIAALGTVVVGVIIFMPKIYPYLVIFKNLMVGNG